MVARVLSLLIGYAFGCILTAEIVARVSEGESSFEMGTGNPGMANAMRSMGKVQGTVVLLGDILKGVLAIAICWLLFSGSVGAICLHYAGLGTVLGHNYPVWHRFRGGKGVTVTCVWTILGFGGWGIICCLVGAAFVGLAGSLALGAAAISIVTLPVAFLLGGAEIGVLFCISCALMFIAHREGLLKIARGEDKLHSKIGKRK